MHGAWRDRPLLDCCGTGGGGLNLINLSTGMMFVLAALGIPVVKHGNRGVTNAPAAPTSWKLSASASTCRRTTWRAAWRRSAARSSSRPPTTPPSPRSARRGARSPRRAGARSSISSARCSTRPSRRRAWSAFSGPSTSISTGGRSKTSAARASTVAYGRDRETGQPIGEISAHGPNQLATSLRPADGADFSEFEHTPSLPLPGKLESLLVRDARESAARLEAILSGRERGLGRETLLVNAAFAAWTQGHCPSVEAALAAAAEALDSGAALKTLRAWQTFSAR
ncbi:MAG: hypothetical protein WDO13_15660 [Verrucomicrobiota bacterium]